MFIVRYANKRGQIIDQIVNEEGMYNVYYKAKKRYGKADLILRRDDGVEYTLESTYQ